MATVVQEGVQRVFSSFVEALRRESLKVSDGNSSVRSVSSAYYCIVVDVHA